MSTKLATATAIVAIILVYANFVGFGVGYGIGYGLPLMRMQELVTEMQTNSSLLEARLHTTQSAMLSFFMMPNVTSLAPVETLIQNGTYSMLMFSTADESEIEATGTYQLKNIELGPLSFTLVVIDSPEVPANWPLFGGTGETFYVIIQYFEPDFDAYRSAGSYQDLTTANKERLVLSSPGSFNNGSVQFSGSGFTMYFDFSAPDGSEPVDTTLTFSSPLQVLLPTI